MTAREKLAIELPEFINPSLYGGVSRCMRYIGYLPEPEQCAGAKPCPSPEGCTACWDREIPETEEKEEKEEMVMPEGILDKNKLGSDVLIDYKKEYEYLLTVCRYYDNLVSNMKDKIDHLEKHVHDVCKSEKKLQELTEEQARTLEKYEMIIRCCEAFVGRPLVDRKEEV